MKAWKFTDASNRAVVSSNGRESHAVSVIQEWLDAGNTPEPADPEPVPSAQSQIDDLERGDLMPRAVREFMLSSIQKEALAEGKAPMLLPAYAKLRARDDQIVALRAKL